MSKEPATLDDALKDALYAVLDPIAPRQVPEKFAAFTDQWLTKYDEGLLARREMELANDKDVNLLMKVFTVMKRHLPQS